MNWQEFRHDSKNKSELFVFLGDQLSKHVCDKIIVTTKENAIITNRADAIAVSALQPCLQT